MGRRNYINTAVSVAKMVIAFVDKDNEFPVGVERSGGCRLGPAFACAMSRV